jgi:hypothetical protein
LSPAPIEAIDRCPAPPERADVLLQAPDLVAQRRLADVEAVGRVTEVQPLRDLEEGAEEREIHRLPIVIEGLDPAIGTIEGGADRPLNAESPPVGGLSAIRRSGGFRWQGDVHEKVSPSGCLRCLTHPE